MNTILTNLYLLKATQISVLISLIIFPMIFKFMLTNLLESPGTT